MLMLILRCIATLCLCAVLAGVGTCGATLVAFGGPDASGAAGQLVALAFLVLLVLTVLVLAGLYALWRKPRPADRPPSTEPPPGP